MKPYLPIHRSKTEEFAESKEQNRLSGKQVLLEKFISSRAIQFYLTALVLCNFVFYKHFLSPMFWIFGITEVVLFFSYSKILSKKWNKYSERQTERKLFMTALIIRLMWVLFSYAFYSLVNGTPFEWEAADSQGYHNEAVWLSDLIGQGKIQAYFDYIKGRYSDMGYAYYLGWQYVITGKSILIARLLKAVYGAFTCLLIYRLAKRNFGESTGRLAAIFCMLMPNLIVYTGLHLKETEMILLTTLFMEQTDRLIRERIFKLSTLTLPLLTALSLFFFRTILGATAVFALFSSLILTTDKVLGMGKRFLLIIWISVAGLYFVGGRIMQEVEGVWAQRGDQQSKSMEFRSERSNGNKMAKYFGGAVFAPMIFAIPFPTVVETPLQMNMKLLNGGYYVKNILAFFTILGLFVLFKEKRWRQHLLLISFVVSYLLVLAFSPFAQSERFHQPVLPFELLLAAYGISQITKKQRKYFNLWVLLIFVVIVVWSWFKLAGRGMA